MNLNARDTIVVHIGFRFFFILSLFTSDVMSDVMIVSLIADFLSALCHATLFQQFRLNSSITESCVHVCYPFHYSLGYICSCSLRFLFKRKTCRCFSNELSSSSSSFSKLFRLFQRIQINALFNQPRQYLNKRT